MSLKLYFDPYDINCFRGEPTTNAFIYPTRQDQYDYSGYFPMTASLRTYWTPRGNQTVGLTKYNNNYPTSGACCPAFFLYQSPTYVTGSTTYCYSMYYKVLNNDYWHPNFLYRYEYNNSNTYLTEGGVFSISNRISYPGGWYRAFGTFTTQPTAAWMTCYLFSYEYNSDNTIYICNPQMEAKTHLTNYVLGSRGVTVTTGGGLIDLAGNSNNADLTYASYNQSTISNNNSFYFDGVSANNCIRVLDATISSNLLPTAKSFSVVVWAKKIANATNTSPILFGYRDTSGNGISLLLYGTTNTSSDFGFVVEKTGGPSLSSRNGAVNTAGWHMYTGVYNNAGAYSNSIVKYYDATMVGTMVSSSNATSAWSKPATSEGGGIVIGTSPSSVNSASHIQNLNGYIGEVRVYDHALSAAEISTLYKLGLTKHI